MHFIRYFHAENPLSLWNLSSSETGISNSLLSQYCRFALGLPQSFLFCRTQYLLVALKYFLTRDEEASLFLLAFLGFRSGFDKAFKLKWILWISQEFQEGKLHNHPESSSHVDPSGNYLRGHPAGKPRHATRKKIDAYLSSSSTIMFSASRSSVSRATQYAVSLFFLL